MITITREEFKKDPVWHRVYEVIKHNHKVADHTMRVLIKNRHIKDFCEIAEHFEVIPMGEKNNMFISYDVASWYYSSDDIGARVKIDSFTIYDNQNEYESARRKGLNSTIHADGANLN